MAKARATQASMSDAAVKVSTGKDRQRVFGGGFPDACGQPAQTLCGHCQRDATRAKRFPRGKFDSSSKTRDKYFRGAWGKGARLEINFYSKGPDKAQFAVQISKLAGKADVEAQREIWKSALGKLQELLDPGGP